MFFSPFFCTLTKHPRSDRRCFVANPWSCPKTKVYPFGPVAALAARKSGQFEGGCMV